MVICLRKSCWQEDVYIYRYLAFKTLRLTPVLGFARKRTSSAPSHFCVWTYFWFPLPCHLVGSFIMDRQISHYFFPSSQKIHSQISNIFLPVPFQRAVLAWQLPFSFVRVASQLLCHASLSKPGGLMSQSLVACHWKEGSGPQLPLELRVKMFRLRQGCRGKDESHAPTLPHHSLCGVSLH